MTTPIQDSPKPRWNKHATWRILNVSLLLIAFFAPWFRACEHSDATANGFQVYWVARLSRGAVFLMVRRLPVFGFLACIF